MISATIALPALTRRKPNSAAFARPRTPEKKIAAPTNARSNSTSLISATAGVGWARLEPPADPIAPTTMLMKIPAPNPTAIAAGAAQIGHLGSSWSAAARSGPTPAAGPADWSVGLDGGGVEIICAVRLGEPGGHRIAR